MRRTAAAALLLVCVVLPVVFVVDQAVRTLRTLAVVERERDTWQRPDEIIAHLNVSPGDTVVDLGSGAGYFTLKIAPRVAPTGQVIAIDLRRQSLAFLWIRTVIRRQWTVRVIRGAVDDPRLPPRPVDAVLIANTDHELSAPGPILDALFRSMRSGATLVVADRSTPVDDRRSAPPHDHHHITAMQAEREITSHGFRTVSREDPLIKRPDEDDIWWLLTFRKP